MLHWLRKEAVSQLGLLGAAMTVLGQLSNVLPMIPLLAQAFAWWQEMLRLLWGPLFDLIGLPLHPHLASAISLAFFLAMIGIGARISAHLGGSTLPPLFAARWLDDMSWPSLAVFSALCLVFLFGNDSDPSAGAAFTWFGSRELGGYAFALLVTAGYIAGNFIGHHEIPLGLYRLALFILVLVVSDFSLRSVIE